MKSILGLIRAVTAALQQLVGAGGIELLVGLWRQRMAESRARERLADEQRLASALARGDLDAVESHAHRLLIDAERANRDRLTAGDLSRSRGGHGDGEPEPVDGVNADVETLQREVDGLLRR